MEERQRVEVEDFKSRMNSIINTLQVQQRTVQLIQAPLYPRETTLSDQIRSQIEDQVDIDH